MNENEAFTSSPRRQKKILVLISKKPHGRCFPWIVTNRPTAHQTFDHMTSEERSAGSDSASEEEEPANNGFFTPERVSRSDHGDKNLENSDNTTTSTNSLLHVPSPLLPRAIHAGAASIGSPVDPDPDVVAAAKMPGHPEVQQTRSFPNFPSEAQMDEGYDSDGFHDCCHEAIEEEGPQDFDEDELVAVPAGVAMNFEPQQPRRSRRGRCQVCRHSESGSRQDEWWFIKSRAC